MPVEGNYFFGSELHNRRHDKDKPTKLSITIAAEPNMSLGVTLTNNDTAEDSESFTPCYAAVGRLLDGDTVARQSGVRPGDCIVAVNGEGFRRFTADYDEAELLDVSTDSTPLASSILDESVISQTSMSSFPDKVDNLQEMNLMSLSSTEDDGAEKKQDEGDDGEGVTADNKNDDNSNDKNDTSITMTTNGEVTKEEDTATPTQVADGMSAEEAKKLRMRVLLNTSTGEAYFTLLKKIKEIKNNTEPNAPPLRLSLERYEWHSRVNAWPRFLAARYGDVKLAMQMIQENEEWRKMTFPIDLRQTGIQNILKAKAISQIDVSGGGCDGYNQHFIPPTVYVDFSRLLALDEQDCTHENVTDTFVLFTELLLAMANDPRKAKTCQFIDLSNTTGLAGLRSGLLRKIYSVFEPNYPETLQKMVMYPVSQFLSNTSRLMLNFVNENTRKKFVLTDDLNVVCQELGWDKIEVVGCGGVAQYVDKYNSDKKNPFIV